MQPTENQPSPVMPMTPPVGQTQAEDPGKTMGIIGLVLAILMPLVGLIISIIARSKSKKAGYKNSLALAGIMVSSVFMVITILLVIVSMSAIVSKCRDLGPGTHYENGVTYTCS